MLESVFIEVLDDSKKKNEIFGCIYRHPSMCVQDFNSNFFGDFISRLSSENKFSYLLGDFNIDLLRADSDPHIQDFFDSLTANLFIPHITLPTRITARSKTLIDNIFSNNPNFENCVSGNFTFSISDHLAQFLIVPSSKKNFLKKNKIMRRDMKNYCREDLVADVVNVDWPTVLEPWKNDPIHSFTNFDKKKDEILHKHFPLKKVSKKQIRLEAKPWITPGIVKSIKRRDILLRKYIKAKDPIRRDRLHVDYKKLRNSIVSVIRSSKTMHYQRYFTENAGNIKKTWSGIKNIINIRSTSASMPAAMLIDKKISSDPRDMAEGFNNYFSTIAEKLLPMTTPGSKHFSSYLPDPVKSNFVFRPTDTVEVMSIIDSLGSEATGPFSVPAEVLKLLKVNLCHPLCAILNMSFVAGIYPDQLKTARVIPVFKKGDKLLVSNYRPISLLSNINKIFEKVVYKRLYSFLNLHNCIFELQFGFRAGHSTNHALLSLTEKVRVALDTGNFACGIFVDFQKAFDTVDHEILLRKLECYGVRGTANNWFRSYLTNRSQFVSINGFDSTKKVMKYGVPQGSVLGPLLFLIYINDLHRAIKFSVTHHFADDTSLLYVGKSIKSIQRRVNLDLRFLSSWLNANKISLNAGKTELLIFRDPRRRVDFDLKIKVDGKRIVPSKFVKYLGIYIDNHLSWHQQEINLRSRLARAAGMLSKIRYYVSFETLRMVYFGIFSSILTYGSQIWGQHNRIVKKLQIVQNRAIRFMNFQPFRASAAPLFKSSGILRLADFVKLQNFLYAHDCLRGRVPLSLIDERFVIINTGLNTSCERLNHISTLSTRTVLYGTNSIKSQSMGAWNFVNDRLHLGRLRDGSKATAKETVYKLLLAAY